MIKTQSLLKVADNTGARKLMCIRVLKGTTAKVGDIIIAVVKDAIPNTQLKKSEIVRAAIVRTKSPIRRKDGTTIRFNENAAIILTKNNSPKASRIFGPIAKEINKIGFKKISSIAPIII